MIDYAALLREMADNNLDQRAGTFEMKPALARRIAEYIDKLRAEREEALLEALLGPVVPPPAPVTQHKHVEIPGHVHWLFVNWPVVESDGAAIEAYQHAYNQWIEDGYTDVKHIPCGDGRLLIEFRKPEAS